MAEQVRVTLSNRVAEFEYPFPPELKGYFRFLVPNHRFMPKFKAGMWDGMISLMRGSRVAAGLFLALKDGIAQEEKFEFLIDDRRKSPEFSPRVWERVRIPGIEEIRPYQKDAVESIIRAAQTGGLVLNATGSGKTLIAGLVFRHLQGRGVFIVDELTLMYQAQDELAKVTGEPVGILGESRFSPERITVATVQTLHKHAQKPRYRNLTEPEVMFIDEVHLALNARQFEVAKSFRPKAMFGLTATLQLRRDSVRLPAMALCGPKLFDYSYTTGVKEKVLAPGVVVGVDLIRDFEDSGIQDYHGLYRVAIVHSRERNDLIEALVREAYRRGKAIILLVERVNHIKRLSERLRNIPHETVFGERKAIERIEAKGAFEAGEIRLMICNKVFKKGINLRRVDLMIDAAAMKNPNDAVQKFGRGVRLSSTKDGLIYLDIGERSPEGQPKFNPFASATRSRRKALVQVGIPIVRYRARSGAPVILDKAEAELQRIISGRSAG